MRQYKRSARFNRLIQEEISDVLRTRLKDPRVGFVSITRVEATEDLRSAKVYVSIFEESHAEETMEVLEKASGFIRRELLPRLNLRRVPALRFILDRNIAYGIHMADVLDRLVDNQDEGPDEGPDEGTENES